MNNIGFYAKHNMLYAWFFAMHTRIDIVLCGEDEPGLKQTIGRIYKELSRLEKVGNYFDPSSELSRVNREAALASVTIGSDLYQMLVCCEEYYQKTEGYFDITIQSDNYNRLTHQLLKVEDYRVSFGQQGVRIDLSGFIKGYALEQIRQILIAEAKTNALVSLGNSSIAALGTHPSGEVWKIKNKEGITCTLHNQCLTTSGNEGSKPHHIICPDTGQFIEHPATLSVITASGIEGEVLSTALFAAPKTKHQQLIERFNAQYIH